MAGASGAVQQKQQQSPTLLGIQEIIGQEHVALTRWMVVKDYFVKIPATRLQIAALLNNGQFLPAIQLTLQSWMAELELKDKAADLKTLTGILHRQRLIRLAGILEETFVQGEITTDVHPENRARVAVTVPSTGPHSRKSEVDRSREITDESWVVSLLRMPDSVHNQHAFIIVEGSEQNSAKIWFIDLISKSGQYGLGNHVGEVRVDPFETDLSHYSQRPPLFYARGSKPDRQMMNPKPGAKILAKSWNIPAVKANTLVRRVTQARSQPPPFVITGDGSLLDFLVPKDGNSGHNCFTWAISQLRSLEEESIGLSLEQLGDAYGNWTAEDFFARTNLAWFTSVLLVAPGEGREARTRRLTFKRWTRLALAALIALISYLIVQYF